MVENGFADTGVESHNSRAGNNACAEKCLEEAMAGQKGKSGASPAATVDVVVDKEKAPLCIDCAIVPAGENDLQVMAKIVANNIAKDGNLGAKDITRHTLDTVLIHMNFEGDDFAKRMVTAINKDLSDAQAPYYVKSSGSGSKLEVELHKKAEK